MRKKGSILAFTLVELIVVVTILAILGTIAFISYNGFSQSARDSVRKTDTKNINKLLSIYKTSNSTYPDPDGAHKVVVENIPLWTEGVFGTGTQVALGKALGDLRDPKYGNQYPYSVTNSKTEYQLASIYENDGVREDVPNLTWDPFPKAHAAGVAPTLSTSDSRISFWYNGRDMDNDGKDDSIDSVISNVGVTANISPVTFSPFYFNRVIWLDAQDLDGNLEADNFSDGEDVSSWINKTGAGFNAFVPQTGNAHSNPSSSTAPSYVADAFGVNSPGIYFNGVNKGDRVVVDRGTQAKGSPFSIAYTFKINDAGGNSAENVGTNHATIISVGPTGGGGYHPRAGAWQLSRDGRLNNFIFRITGNIPEANKTYFNGADCNRNSGANSCGTSSQSAEIAFGDWSEVNDNQPHTVFVTYDGTTVTGFLDGTKRFEAIMENTDPYGEYFRFYGNRAGTAYLEGMMGEVFITDEKVSLQDLQKIEWYFSNKWNYDLPVGHPYEGVSNLQMDEASELIYTRYEGDGLAIDDFDPEIYFSNNPVVIDTKTLKVPATTDGINIQEENKTHIWRGIMKVSESGNYTFTTTSDDYSFIQIADAEDPSSSFQTVVDNGGEHLATTESGTISLIGDRSYEFLLVYGQLTGPAELDFRVDGPGIVTYRKYEATGWYDISTGTSVKHLVQPVSLRAPSYNPLKFSMNFDAQSYLEFPSGNAPYSGSDSGHVFAVVEIASSSPDGIGGFLFENEASSSTGSVQLGTRGISAGNIDQISSDIEGKQLQLVSYEFDQSNNLQSYFIGGQKFLSQNSDVANIDGAFFIGGKNSTFEGEIHEIIGFEGVLTEQDRNDIEGFISQKWDISHKLSIEHPYYTLPDTGEEVFVNVFGDYNGMFVHGNLNDTHIVVASPAIMSSEYVDDGETVSFSSLIAENKLVYNGYRNIPWSYAGAEEDFNKLTLKDGFFFNYNNTKVFEGSKLELGSYKGISQIDEQLRLIYSNSYLHEFVSDELEDNSVGYVKDILGNIIGVNPIVPFYCKDILDNSRGSNVAFDATPTGNAGLIASDGLVTINDANISLEGSDYTYLTNPNSPTDKSVGLIWDDPIDGVSLIRVHNAFGEYSRNLKFANLKVLDTTGAVVDTYIFGDTNGEAVIEIYPTIPSGTQVKSIEITPQDFDQVGLREIEVFSGDATPSGNYKVDDDGVGGKGSYTVYCDMETDGGGWTKVGNNYVYNGAFYGGQNVENWYPSYSSNNTITNITNPGPTSYALRQYNASASDNDNIYYRIDFENLTAFKANREIRLTVWMRYDGGTTSTHNPFSYYMRYNSGDLDTNGTVKTLQTKLFGGSVWSQKELRISLDDDVDEFYWKLGENIDKNSSKTLYFADLQAEVYFK